MNDLARRGPLGLKAPKLGRGTIKGKMHMARIARLPCVVCHRPGPSKVHHLICGRFGSSRADDFNTIPLCFECHRGPHGIHAGKESWVAINGPDTDFLPVVADMLSGEFNAT
jgi:hypothetical protein